MVVAIDGPAGAGKSTVARAVARELGFRYIDTGAMYRAVGWKVIARSGDPLDETGLEKMLETTAVELANAGSDTRVLLDGEDVSAKIRTAEVSQAASKVSSLRIVREKMVDLQRNIGRGRDVVAEGRDMGTVVFPDAEVKVYLDATPEERAARRYRELCANGEQATLEETLREARERDRRDTERAFSPLRPADGALRIDSTGLTVAQVVGLIVEEVRKKRSKIKDGRLVS